MAETADIPVWIVQFVGLYSLAAAIGEWRTPGLWAAMLFDFERSPGLRFVTGLFLLSLGAAVYMVNLWRPDDWLSIVVSVLGGITAFEGAIILAMGDPVPELRPPSDRPRQPLLGCLFPPSSASL